MVGMLLLIVETGDEVNASGRPVINMAWRP